MRPLLILVALIPSATSADESLLRCLRSAIHLGELKVERVGDASYLEDYRNLKFDVTNNLTWAISGIVFDYEIRSPDRSVPWVQEISSESIPGGIEPGETRNIILQIDDMPHDPLASDAIVEVSIRDLADPLQRQMIGSPIVIGWATEISDRPCP